MKDYWQYQAEQDLREYEALKVSIQNLPEQIAELREQMTALRSPGADSGGSHGGGTSADSRVINLVCLIDEQEKTLKANKRHVRQIERALKVLTAEERRVLELFYITGEANAAERLMDELCVARKAVYYRREQALMQFAIAMHGKG